MSQARVSGGGDSTSGDHMWGLDRPGPAGHAGPEAQEALPSDPTGTRPCPSSREGSRDTLGGRGDEPAQLSLYTHCIQGLVLSLLAEEQLCQDHGAVQDVVSGEKPAFLQGLG